MGATTADYLQSVMAGVPDVSSALTDAHRVAWETTDPVILELCRHRVATLLGTTIDDDFGAPEGAADELLSILPSWPTSPRFSAAQRACLAFTEEFVIDVASLSDATADAVIAELGEAGFMDFVNALLIVEQRLRMRLAWQRLGIAS